MAFNWCVHAGLLFHLSLSSMRQCSRSHQVSVQLHDHVHVHAGLCIHSITHSFSLLLTLTLLRYLGNFLIGNLLEVRFFESILTELANISPIKWNFTFLCHIYVSSFSISLCDTCIHISFNFAVLATLIGYIGGKDRMYCSHTDVVQAFRSPPTAYTTISGNSQHYRCLTVSTTDALSYVIYYNFSTEVN